MKNFVFTFIAVLLFFYLLGCFVATSFCISDWDILLRSIIVLLGSISAVICAFSHEELK